MKHLTRTVNPSVKEQTGINTMTITNGSRQVVATQNTEGCKWHARLYVGEVATLQSKKFASKKGMERWAAKILA